ncbi:LytR/AlgR family response regulator transcription factor [Bacteroidota bacterium]
MKTWQHIAFWILMYSSLTLILADWFNGAQEAFLYVSFLLPVIIGVSYFFNYFLVPRYLFQRKFGLFILYLVYMLIVSLCLEMIASVLAFLVIVIYGINKNLVLITDVFTLGGLLYFVVLLHSFILLIGHYFMDQRIIDVLEKKQKQVNLGYFTVRSNRQTSRIFIEEVLYIESLADYIQIHMADGRVVQSKEKISCIEASLPEGFVRIHRSFIVNKARVSSFSRESVLIGPVELPLSRTYKKKAFEKLSLQSL